MTSGTIGSALPGPYTLGKGFRRAWTGTDGKYTTFAGKQVEKWNNYTAQFDSWDYIGIDVIVSWIQQRTLPSDGTFNSGTTGYNVGFYFDSPLDWSSNDQLKLLNKLVQKVKSHDFNLAVNLGQLHQTVDLLASNLQKLGRAAIALKRGNFAVAARQLGITPRGTRLKTSDISGRWLELQYGWLPLLSDSFEAAKAFEAISNGPRTTTYRASSKLKQIGNGSQSKTFFDMPYQETYIRAIIYECVEEMGFARQLGLLDPLSVAWELTPWSFVVDWFIPIGSYIDLVNTVPFLKGRFLTVESRKRETAGAFALKSRFTDTHKQPPWDAEVFTGVLKKPIVKYKQTQTSRTYSEALSVPLPGFQTSGAVHGRRLWNAISLAQQRFGPALIRSKPGLLLGDLARLRVL